MAGRPQGVQSFVVNGTGLADQAIKANPGKLYSVNISWTGANVGDVLHIEDALSADPANKKIHSIRMDTAAGSHNPALPAVGLEASIGLWLNLQASGGNFSINIGFD